MSTPPESTVFNFTSLGRRHYVHRDGHLVAVTASKQHALAVVDESIEHQIVANEQQIQRSAVKMLAHADQVETTYIPLHWRDSAKRYTEYTVTTAAPPLREFVRAWFNRWF